MTTLDKMNQAKDALDAKKQDGRTKGLIGVGLISHCEAEYNNFWNAYDVWRASLESEAS